MAQAITNILAQTLFTNPSFITWISFRGSRCSTNHSALKYCWVLVGVCNTTVANTLEEHKNSMGSHYFTCAQKMKSHQMPRNELVSDWLKCWTEEDERWHLYQPAPLCPIRILSILVTWVWKCDHLVCDNVIFCERPRHTELILFWNCLKVAYPSGRYWENREPACPTILTWFPSIFAMVWFARMGAFLCCHSYVGQPSKFVFGLSPDYSYTMAIPIALLNCCRIIRNATPFLLVLTVVRWPCHGINNRDISWT